MFQKVLQSKLLWTFALKMRRRWFEKKGIDRCGEATYQEIIQVIKGFIKHDKLRSIKFI